MPKIVPHTLTGPRPVSVSVSCWGELAAERRLPGVLRVLVDGQHAGAVERIGSVWAASWYTAANRGRVSEHASADEAVRAVVRSGWARKLGARAASRFYWSARAVRAAGRRDGAR